MRIALVDPAAYSLPYDAALCEALANRGHDVTLYTTRFAHGPMPDAQGFEIVEWFYRRNPMRLAGLGQRMRRALRAMQHPKNLRQLLRRLDVDGTDVVHVQWLVAGRYDSIAYRRLVRAPTLLTVHNATPREGANPLRPEWLGCFDAIVAHSNAGVAHLRSLLADGSSDAVRTPRVLRIPHGAFTAFRTIGDPASPPVDIDPARPTIVLAGLLRPYKGVSVLLAAWPRIHTEIPDAQLVIAGRPMGIGLPDPPPTGATLLPRFLDDREFGWLLRAADVVCLPYTSVDLSGVLFGAMALGRPLVLSDVGGFSELAGHGAVLVPPANSDALADALVDVLRHEELRQRLSAESAAAADGEYSWDDIASRHEALYASLAP